MSDVVVKEVVKVTHATACTDSRTCGCRREVVGYRYEICFQWPSGKLFRERKQVPVGRTTKTKAETWANDRLRNILAQGEHKLAERKEVVEQTQPAVTLDSFGPRYVVEYLKANRRKPRTVDEYEGILDFYLYPRFGNRPLDGLTQPDVQKLKGDLEDLSPKTVNNVLSVLSTLLTYAVEAGEIAALPVTIRQLKVAPVEVEFYESAVFEGIVEVANKLDPRSHIVVLLGGDAGLRRGEIVGLEWTDIDFVRGRLTVNRSESKGHVSLPKGGRPRSLKMTCRLSDALKAAKHLRGKRVFWRDPEYRWDKAHAMTA
jgi:integrase